MDQFGTLTEVPQELRGSVVAIGNFDGVHNGHRAMLAQARARAASLGVKCGVVTFEPHPRALFRPDDPPFRITAPALKRDLLGQCGVDFIVSLRFDWDFASQSAEQFAGAIAEYLAPVDIFIGEDFRFGQLRKGSAATFRAAGLTVTDIAAVADEQGRVFSSTAVRAALREGDIETANTMLGWAWEITGPVFRGDRRGHELGYPTANILLGDLLHPAYGIYACFVQIEGEDQWRMAATNIGIRPMFELKQGQVEAHILDFPDRDIYDRTLRVRPVKRLRGEAKFASLDELIVQMDKDCAQARSVLTKQIPSL